MNTAFNRAYPGDGVILLDTAYEFNVATYKQEIDPQWIYTYSYAPEQAWVMPNNDCDESTWRKEDYIFSSEVYFRVYVRRCDGTEGATDNAVKIVTTQKEYEEPEWLAGEAYRVASRVNEQMQEGDMAFVLMTDSHFVVNGTHHDTARAVKLLSEKIKMSGIIHLGDFTDGSVPADATKEAYAEGIRGLADAGLPIYKALGNHDYNYFKKNPEKFTIDEMRNLYCDGGDVRYFVDFPGLRFIFLDCFDPDETIRYGYSCECLEFLNKTLGDTQTDTRVIIFSHLPPISRLQYWTSAIRGSNEMANILKKYTGKIIAFINGHNHADHLDNDAGVPVISIANAKCEEFTEKKPKGYITPKRLLGNATQECFDVVLVNSRLNRIRFIRFGSGNDRLVCGGFAEWIKPLVSIIVPVYNVEEYLERCVDSLLAQTYKNIEIILINDGSIDNSGAICDGFAEKDARVRVIHQLNKGVSAARNAGLDAAQGDYIGFVDSDDYIHPKMYQKLLLALRDSGKNVSVCGYTVDSANKKKNRDVIHRNLPKDIPRMKALEYVIRQKYIEGQIWNMLFCRAMIERGGPTRFDEDVHGADDRLFAVRTYINSNGFAYVPESLYYFWQRQGSVTNTFNERRMTLSLAYERIHEAISPVSDELAQKARYNCMDVAVYLINRATRSGQYEHLPKLKKNARKYALEYFTARELSMAKKMRNCAVTFFPRLTNNSWKFLQRRANLKNFVVKLNKR